MASSSGSGFTASIVNGIANYVSSDLSNLGMANGVSGSIQYVKMVWGASGESNLISDNAVDPSSLPVSLNTPENKFLTDALINGMTYTSGVTAFAVKIIDATGLSFGAVNVSMGSGVTIVGFAAGATNANLGVTFGPVGMSGGFLPITNRIIGGVTQSIQVTGGMYILGGTVSVTGLDVGSLSLNLTAGVTINGMTGDKKLGVTFDAATVSGTVDTHLKSIQSGVTLPVILTKHDGTFLGIGSGESLLVSGVEGATAVGVTFDGTVGVTWVGGITGSVHILALPAVTGSVYINGTPTVVVSGSITSITEDVPVKPAEDYRNSNTTVLAGRTAQGFIVTQKAGSNFARGLTLDANFIGSAFVSGSLQLGTGNTIYYLKSNPVCVTKDYSGPGSVVGAALIDGQYSVPLKVGLYIQLTKWDLISHVLVGYTAGTTQEFARNAQTLTREYQVAPIWGNAMEQFRKYAGSSGNSSSMTGGSVSTNDALTPIEVTEITTVPVQKQFIGVIEKPTRLFIPCKDAGEVYIQVIGDYTNHAIGSGFWTYEGATAQWSAHTLYERGYFASDYSGIAGYNGGNDIGGDPSMNISGTQIGSYGGDGNVISTIAVQKIIDSYANNPFIRIWGH